MGRHRKEGAEHRRRCRATAAGETERFERVVSNMDSIRTYRELVGGDVAARYDRKGFEPACSGVVLYLGLNKRYDHLAHHDFVFSRDPEEEFHHIYDKGEPAPDPTATSVDGAVADAGPTPTPIDDSDPSVSTGNDPNNNDTEGGFPPETRGSETVDGNRRIPDEDGTGSRNGAAGEPGWRASRSATTPAIRTCTS